MARVLREEILMIVLGRVELPIRLDLCHDGRVEDARLVELRNIGLGNPGLLRIRRKDGRAILRADIRTLAIELGWVMGDREIDLHDSSITVLSALKIDHNAFIVASPT